MSQLADAFEVSRQTHSQICGRERVKEFESFRKQAEKRLEILDAAVRKEDLVRLPSNRFEALRGDRQGQYSIRINAQWRICFEWVEGEEKPHHIEITDYH